MYSQERSRYSLANNLYLYDNNTGIDIPVKFGNRYEATVLLGKTLNDVKNQIAKNSIGFCVFSSTGLDNIDFVVPTSYDREFLSEILDSHLIPGNIEVRESSMWYSDNARKSIIINPINKNSSTIRTILIGYFNILPKIEESIKPKNVTVYESSTYSVVNTRNNKVLMKGTRLDLLKGICDKSPCCCIKDINGNIVYRTKFWKVTIPTGNPKSVDSLKKSKELPGGKASAVMKIYL